MSSTHLADLFPKLKENVIDVVRNAGHDVTPWSFKDKGKTPVAKPEVNPNYCYRWSFREEGQSPLLCLWFHELKEENGRILHENNAREEALRLERTAENKNATDVEINRANKRAKEARRMNTCVMDAFRRQIPVKVAIVYTKKPFRNNLEPASADLRQLDTVDWVVSKYDMDTGAFQLERGGRYPTPLSIAEEKYEDQFSGSDKPIYEDKAGHVAVRDRDVRNQVLLRANGRCEHCNAPGFITKSGKIYLETHHIIPLCEGGADRVYNVIALCPNDHRMAHFSENHETLRASFLQKLGALGVIKPES